VEYRQLGRSGLRVSALAMGTMTFGGKGLYSNVGTTGVDEAREQIAACIDAGVNLIDTANIYSRGVAEEVTGHALQGRRDEVLLATKVRLPMGDGPNDAGLSRYHIIRSLEASLRRLQTDHVDLYQVHQWDGQTPPEETAAALDSLVQSGKIRYLGASNLAGWQLMKALAVADRHGYQRYVSQQIHYSLQAREAENELVPLGIDQGVGILVWSPLAGGLLTGKFRRGQVDPDGTRKATGVGGPPVLDEAKLYDIVDVLVDIAGAHGVSAAQVALAWTLARPGVTSAVIGARTIDQLTDNLAAANLELTEAEHDLLEVVSRPPLPYPHWHQVAMAADRLSDGDLAHLAPYLG
jgi:aryl-alcohol dehydrogenase-like predicted oxidoreductase